MEPGTAHSGEKPIARWGRSRTAGVEGELCDVDMISSSVEAPRLRRRLHGVHMALLRGSVWFEAQWQTSCWATSTAVMGRRTYLLCMLNRDLELQPT